MLTVGQVVKVYFDVERTNVEGVARLLRRSGRETGGMVSLSGNDGAFELWDVLFLLPPKGRREVWVPVAQ